MKHEVREAQLNLLGQLPVAKVTITLHVEDGVPARQWWISGEDLDGDQLLMYSSATSAGPAGGLHLPELMQELHQVFRLTRGLPSTARPV